MIAWVLHDPDGGTYVLYRQSGQPHRCGSLDRVGDFWAALLGAELVAIRTGANPGDGSAHYEV